MPREYRYRCGACRYRTPWLAEPAAADQRDRHYAHSHPGLAPGAGGSLRSRPAHSREGIGCLLLVALLLLLLIVAASWHVQPFAADGHSAPVHVPAPEE